jgi:hypothetical protein
MHHLPVILSRPSFAAYLLASILLFGASRLPAAAEAAPSLLPAFGTKGYDFKKQAQPGHEIGGWLPKGWEDNSSWAKVSATYTQLTDSPVKDAGAVRIHVTRRDAHHVQMRASNGPHLFRKGTKYVVTGWLRSPESAKMNISFRQDDDPKEYYDREDLATTPEWTRFTHEWTPDADSTAWLMFMIHDPSTVDIAGIEVRAEL